VSRILMRITAIAFVTFLSLGTANLSAQSQNNTAGDSAAIKLAVDGFVADFNRHDAHASAAWFTDEAEFTNVQQVTSHGRKDYEDHMVQVFKTRLKNAHRTVSITSIRFLTPDVATATMTYELGGTMGPNDTELPLRKGVYRWVLTKHNERWLIDIMEESEPVQPPSSTSH
jgi:uncharacterized protein (TIGR02246 family)